VDEGEQPDDSQRFSAPGNVFPVIHASTEGEAPRVKVTFEDWAGAAPLLTLTWKEVGREENIRKIAFPVLKSKPVQIPALVYNGLEEKLESLSVELDFDKEGDYLAFLDLLPALPRARREGCPALGAVLPRLVLPAAEIKNAGICSRRKSCPSRPRRRPNPGPPRRPSAPARASSTRPVSCRPRTSPS